MIMLKRRMTVIVKNYLNLQHLKSKGEGRMEMQIAQSLRENLNQGKYQIKSLQKNRSNHKFALQPKRRQSILIQIKVVLCWKVRE